MWLDVGTDVATGKEALGFSVCLGTSGCRKLLLDIVSAASLGPGSSWDRVAVDCFRVRRVYARRVLARESFELC